MIKIFIDAGHGGADSGAVGHGLKEKVITLKIAIGIVNELSRYKGVLVKASRTKDGYLSLSERTRKANKWKANLFLSIHVNSASGNNGTGFESFTDIRLKGENKTDTLRKTIHTEIMKQLPNVFDRGRKKDDLHVLRESHMDAVLTECLFINNSIDSLKLKDKKVIQKFIDGHVNGIVKVYNLKLDSQFQVPEKPTIKPSKPSKKDDVKKEVYQVVCGSFKEKSNAMKVKGQLDRLKVDCYILRVAGLYRVVAGTFTSRDYAKQRIRKLKKMGFDAFLNIA